MNVIIVGATSGIGYEMARQYAQKGSKIGVTGRRTELLDALKNEFPNQIFIKKHDVVSDDNLMIINELAAEMGGFDLFIYNAGFGHYNRELDFEIEKTTIQINLLGFVECIGWAYNFLKKQGHGTLVGISSIAGERGHFRAPAYNASKAFMSNYLQGLHAKARKENRKIAVVDIRPGFVLTPMTAQNKDMFWVASVQKAAKQIIYAIEKRKKVAYITRRWALVAFVFRHLPAWIYRTI